MDETRRDCANCGHPMIPYRITESLSKVRRVRMHWLLCSSCRHVSLLSWHPIAVDYDRQVLSAGHVDNRVTERMERRSDHVGALSPSAMAPSGQASAR